MNNKLAPAPAVNLAGLAEQYEAVRIDCGWLSIFYPPCAEELAKASREYEMLWERNRKNLDNHPAIKRYERTKLKCETIFHQYVQTIALADVLIPDVLDECHRTIRPLDKLQWVASEPLHMPSAIKPHEPLNESFPWPEWTADMQKLRDAASLLRNQTLRQLRRGAPPTSEPEWWETPAAINPAVAIAMLNPEGLNDSQKYKVMERIRNKAGTFIRCHKAGNEWLYHWEDWERIVKLIHAKGSDIEAASKAFDPNPDEIFREKTAIRSGKRVRRCAGE